MSKLVLIAILTATVVLPMPQTKSDARLQYLGSVTIYSRDPKALAGWYTAKLGLDVSSQYKDMYYGGFGTKAGDFNVGIHPFPRGIKDGVPNISLTFRVSDFRSYSADLRSRGLVPIREENDQTGHFMTFKDPDGNEVTIWGD